MPKIYFDIIDRDETYRQNYLNNRIKKLSKDKKLENVNVIVCLFMYVLYDVFSLSVS